jgi:hypothetical protein
MYNLNIMSADTLAQYSNHNLICVPDCGLVLPDNLILSEAEYQRGESNVTRYVKAATPGEIGVNVEYEPPGMVKSLKMIQFEETRLGDLRKQLTYTIINAGSSIVHSLGIKDIPQTISKNVRTIWINYQGTDCEDVALNSRSIEITISLRNGFENRTLTVPITPKTRKEEIMTAVDIFSAQHGIPLALKVNQALTVFKLSLEFINEPNEFPPGLQVVTSMPEILPKNFLSNPYWPNSTHLCADRDFS